MKNLLIFVLSFMLIAAIPMTVSAADVEKDGNEQAKNTAQEIKTQNVVKDPFDYTTSQQKLEVREADRPAKFDLSGKFINDGDNKSYVTPVRFQNPFGTCWGFSAVAAAESSILGSGLAADDGYDANRFDLSEKHLVYFFNTFIADKDSSQYGEGRHDSGNKTVADKLNSGGLPFYAASLFASGMGPNLEKRDSLDAGDEDILMYKGRSGEVQQRKINGKWEDFCYDDEDDWSIPEKYRYYQSYTMKEAFMLPSPAGKTAAGNYKYNPAATDTIKDQLLQKRGVCVAFLAESYLPSQEKGDGKYISKNWAHYTYDSMNINHGVTIVGWDDTYPKENFIQEHQPPADGAWLVKNSWGSGEEEFPCRGTANWGIVDEDTGKHTGYFWLSYYDHSLSKLESFEFDKSNVGKEYYLDQYDLLPVSEIKTIEEKDNIKMANVFKAETCQELKSITCQTAHPGTTVISQIYLLGTDYKNPSDGLLVGTLKKTYEIGGIHKMNIVSDRIDGKDDPVIIQKGQHYSIVQTHTTADGKHVAVYPCGAGKQMAKLSDSDYWFNAVVNKGESFFYGEGNWTDYTKVIDYLDSGDEKGLYTYDNFPIKALCDQKENIRIKVNSSVQLPTRNPDPSLTSDAVLRLAFRGDKDVDVSDREIKWYFVEGGDKIASIRQDPDDDSLMIITAKSEGKTKLIVEVEGVGRSVISVTAIEPRLVKAIAIGDELIYNGKKRTAPLVVIDSLGGLVEKKYYKVTYKNNVKCGEATATAKPTDSYYKGSASLKFRIIPRKAVISDLKAGKRLLKVRVKSQKSSGVTKYQLQYRKAGTKKWIKRSFSSGKSTFTIKKLIKGKRYQVRIRAYAKNAGYGEFSKLKKSGKIK